MDSYPSYYSDFLNYINKYDFLFLTETWHSYTSNIDIDNFLNFSCPSPKCNRKAKRDSGGVVIYYHKKYFGHVKLMSVNNKGLIWIKLDKGYFSADNDVYICNCYIPPEDSNVYKSRLSPLFDFDFFEHLLYDISEYERIGGVILIGDFNSQVGQRSVLIENINLDRFVDLPVYDVPIDCLPPRSFDNQCNSFGNKLLLMFKEKSICIANGRKGDGKFTCNNRSRSRVAASIVDYIIL